MISFPRYSVFILIPALLIICDAAWSDNEIQPLSLSQLERQLIDGVSINLADMKLQQRLNELDTTAAQSGLKIYGGVNYSNDVLTLRDEGNDGIMDGEIGLKYPLFGNQAEEKIDQISAEYSTKIAYLKRQTQVRANLKNLHEQYIQYWENYTNLNLARVYLNDRSQIIRRLNDRVDQALLLPADKLEFSSSFDKAAMDRSMYAQNAERALHTIGALVGRDIQSNTPMRPEFNHACMDEKFLKLAVSQSNPEIRLLELEQRKHIDSYDISKWVPIKASAYAGLRFGDDFRRSDGDRWGVGIGFTLPVNLKAAMKGHQAQTRVAEHTAALQLKKRRAELTSEITTAIDQYRTASYGVQFAVQQIMTGREALREAWLRFHVLDGDVMERLQSARYQYYRMAVNGVIAQAKFFKAQAHLLNYLPEGCSHNLNGGILASVEQVDRDLHSPLLNMGVDQGLLPGNQFSGFNFAIPGVTGASAASDWGRSMKLYVWASRDFFSVVNAKPQYLTQLSNAGIRHLWISLDQQQIEAAISNPGELLTQIEAIHRHGLQVELLLGEPSWLLATKREKLINIIENLASFPFDGLHLDLEPEQLERYIKHPVIALQLLVDTLNDVYLVSPWPISFSTHYRNLLDPAICLVCAAQKLGISRISMMVYVSNPRRVIEIAGPIINAYPDTNFNIAQSLEPSLTAEESLWHGTPEKFKSSVLQLANIKGDNFDGIAIQSWSHYEAYQ